VVLIPIGWILFQTSKSNIEFFQGIWTIPERIHWENFTRAWTEYDMGTGFFNSVYYVGVGLVISTFITTISAYALTRLEWKGRTFIWGTLWLSLFLPGINALVPQYILMKGLGLTNSLTGIIILDSFGE